MLHKTCPDKIYIKLSYFCSVQRIYCYTKQTVVLSPGLIKSEIQSILWSYEKIKAGRQAGKQTNIDKNKTTACIFTGGIGGGPSALAP
jgi:hypothetical protein